MDNIPKITEKQVQEQHDFLNEKVVHGDLPQWVDTELEGLRVANPVLHGFILSRSNKFAIGAVIVHDPHSIAVSFLLEQLLLLNLLRAGYSSTVELEKFGEMMQTLLPSGLEGLDNFGKNNKENQPN